MCLSAILLLVSIHEPHALWEWSPFCYIYAGHPVASCNTFGNKLNQSDPPDAASALYYAKNGTYFGVGSPLQCAGNATTWKVCYFPAASPASATLAVYRKSPPNGSTYNRVNLSRKNLPMQNYMRYTCMDIPSGSFTVNQGDVLVGCVQQNGSRIAANISTSSVLYNRDSYDCGSPTIDIASYNLQQGLTLLISLGRHAYRGQIISFHAHYICRPYI